MLKILKISRSRGNIMADNDMIQWDDSYSVGSQLIDGQHKELITMTNRLYEGCRRGGVTEKVLFIQTIQGAVNYVKTHFSTEEKFMEQTCYPELEAHRREHQNFIDEVMRQVKRFENDEQFVPGQFARFLLDWILTHIAKSDKKYIPYLKKLKDPQ
jgi:hemerythrin